MQRCMPSGFFVLLRLLVRVDKVLIRVFDTRYHYKCVRLRAWTGGNGGLPALLRLTLHQAR